MNYKKIKNQLINHEGMRLKPYKCSAGKLTIGIGRNLDDRGITNEEAIYLFYNDIVRCENDLKGLFSNWNDYPENIQMVLMDMRFQLGGRGLRGFRLMIRAVYNRDWQEMIRQMKDSKWYKQTPNRAKDLIELVRSVM